MPRELAKKKLTDYPRPSVAVDTAVLTVLPEPRTLGVLLIRRRDDSHPGEWSLPGRILREHERLADAVSRSLEDKVGLTGRRPEQLRVFDDPCRDDRGWVLSVAHLDVLPWSAVEPVVAARPKGVCLRPVDDVRGLPFGHDEIVRLAAETVRRAYRELPDPHRLLELPAFTMRQLQALHASVVGDEMTPDVVRRLATGHVEETGRKAVVRVGKPAMTYRWR